MALLGMTSIWLRRPERNAHARKQSRKQCLILVLKNSAQRDCAGGSADVIVGEIEDSRVRVAFVHCSSRQTPVLFRRLRLGRESGFLHHLAQVQRVALVEVEVHVDRRHLLELRQRGRTARAQPDCPGQPGAYQYGPRKAPSRVV